MAVTEGATPAAEGCASVTPEAEARRSVPRRARRHGARWTMRFSRIAVLIPLVFLVAAPFLLIGQEITAPSWVRERVEAAAAEALGGGTLRFGAITVRVPNDLHPQVRLLDVTLTDRDGRLLARVPEVTAQVSPRGLIFERQLLVQEIALVGAELSLSRGADGRVQLAFGQPDHEPAASTNRDEGLASIPDQFERIFERPALSALRTIRVDGLVVNYDDARAGRRWTVDGGTLALDLRDGVTRLVGDVSVLSGRSYVTHAQLAYESPRLSRAASMSITLTDVAASDVASQSPALAWMSAVDAPVSMALRAELDDQGALGPTTVALKMAAGELRPHAAAAVGFDLARAYLAYDPATQAVRFDRVEVRSDWGSVLGSGEAYLREVRAGLPRALLGQFTLREITADPPGLYDEPAHLPEATAQFRLRLDPFTVDIAEASVGLPGEDASRLDLSGQVAASPEGWSVALDGRLPEVGRDRILALWPERLRPGLRDWLDSYLTAGTLRDVAAALRLRPGRPAAFALTSGFAGLTVQPLPYQPPITGGEGRMSWEGGTFSAALDRGRTAAPQGGVLDLAGTAITIHPGDAVRSPATVDLRARGPITAALSVLDQPPWRFLTSAQLPVALAEGRAEAAGRLDFFIGPMRPDELRLDVAATLSDVTTDVLIPGRVLTADSLAVGVTQAGIEVGGAMRVGTAAVQGTWTQRFGVAEGGRSSVAAQVEISPRVLDEFGILLPEGSVSGEGTGELTLALAPGEAPAFSFRSGLEGIALSLPEIGWSKRAGRSGELLVEGSLGAPVRVDRISLSASGLRAEGDLRLTSNGAFDALRLSRVALGDWLDAPVTLTARRGSDTPAIEVRGGMLDLRRATFGGDGSGGGGGQGGPITVALDRLQITDSIALTDFAGDFSTVSGLEGDFSGFVNGGPAVSGQVAPQGDRVAARVQGQDAGAVMKAADLFTRAEGGSLDMMLLPTGPESYTGQMSISGLKVREAPVLASLLNAASVVGLLQQLGGQGIVFDEVSAEFRIDPTTVSVSRSSAMGAGLGLSMDGVFDSENYLMDFQGVVSPFYLLNGIGSILTRPGEGLLGFNFTLKGDPDDPSVGVNPLSVLTPGMFREIFRRPAPSLGN
jgi:hypothetical protein